MTSELKVYNQFREMILHIRLTYGDAPELLTIDATEEMRSAAHGLIGRDFDRTIGKGGDLLRLTARWGDPDYAQVLAEYFSNNFGWSTWLIEREQPLSARAFTTAGEAQIYATKAEENTMAGSGAWANRLCYAGTNLATEDQLGSGYTFDPLLQVSLGNNQH
ncbi:MAG: hypothetical protein WAM04_17580 [Candidatus Sulfotelmatobacter sp.]